MPDYTYNQAYSFGSTYAGDAFTVTNQADEEVATGVVAAGGSGVIPLTVPDDVPSTLTFTRDSDSRKLATVEFDPRDIAYLNRTSITPEQIAEIAAGVGEGVSDAVVTGVERDGGMLQSYELPMSKIREATPDDAPVALGPMPDEAATQWVEGYLLKKDGTRPNGVAGTFTPVEVSATGYVLYGDAIEVMSNRNGYVKKALLKGTWIADFPETTVVNKQFTLDGTTVDLSTLV